MVCSRKTVCFRRRNIVLFMMAVSLMVLLNMKSIEICAESTVVSGVCGDDLTWSMDLDTGVLRITGSGTMNGNQPWSAYKASIQSVEIGSNVANIGVDAFNGCTRLKTIAIPSNVSTIGAGAFSGCTSLSHVEIPGSVVSIGDYAFRECRALKEIQIPDSVTSIYHSAFYECSALTAVKLPSGLASISDNLFYECVNLKSVNIPDGVTAIGNSAFDNCHSLEDVVIPSKVTSIGYDAFYGCLGLTEVAIPSSVQSIGSGAFEYCTSLKNVVIPYSVTSIGSAAFYGCGNLSDVYYRGTENDWKAISIGNSNQHLTFAEKHYNFEGKVCVHEWGSGTVTKEAGCVSEGEKEYICTLCGEAKRTVIAALGHILEGNTCSICGESAIGGDCGAYMKWYLNTDTGVLSITGSGMMNGNQPWSAYKASIQSVEIGSNVANIGVDAFNGCTRLKTIAIPSNVSTIGAGAFSGCTSLSHVEIPGSVVSIGDYAFRECRALKEIEIPDSVTSIYHSAFYECSALTTVKLPSGLASISDNLFYECVNLKSVNIPDGVTAIGNSAFDNCHSLEDVVIPSKVTSIGYDAFYGCSGLTGVVIPSSVQSIGSSAFENCTSLRNVVIPYSVTTISNAAFRGCGNLSDVYYRGSEDDWNAISIGGNNEHLTFASVHYDFSGTICSHSKIKIEAVEAGCTQEGNMAYWHCETCGKIYSDAAGIGEISEQETVIPANGHNTVHYVANEATCITDGNIEYWHCDTCNKYFEDEECTEEIAEEQTIAKATGIHALTNHASQAASCIAEGNIEYWACDICGRYFADEKAESEITEDEIILEKIDHSKDGGTVTKAATCTEKGIMTYACTVCGETSTEELPALGHKLKVTEEKPVTCTDDGNIEYWTCDICGRYFKDEKAKTEITPDKTIIKKTGHKFGDWEIKEEPTVISEGSEVRKCSVCGETETRTIDKLPVDPGSDDDISTPAPAPTSTNTPTPAPTLTPTPIPTITPTPVSTSGPDVKPEVKSSVQPTVKPSTQPEVKPSMQPTVQPSVQPNVQPSEQPQKVGTVWKDAKSGISYVVTVSGEVSNGTIIGAELEVTKGNKNAKSVIVPETVTINNITYKVTAIKNNAFKNSRKLTKVIIGNGIKTIGSNAFSGCKKLKTITIKSKNLTGIGKNAFKGISEKATIIVPKSKLKKYKKLLTSKAGYRKSMKIKGK